MLRNESDLANIVVRKPDLVFLGVKSIRADDDTSRRIWVSEYLEKHDINFTGSRAPAMRLDFDKFAAKEVVGDAGLATARSFEAIPEQFTYQSELPLSFPLFLKPPTDGSGRGIDDESVARDFDSFTNKVESIMASFGTPTLVEEYLVGREFSVAVLGTATQGIYDAMPIELLTDKNEHGDSILTNTIKEADTEARLPVEDNQISDEIRNLAVDVFNSLGGRDYGRIDFRMNGLGEVQFLEANLMPGVSTHGYFASAMHLNREVGYEDMILKIVELALARQAHSQV